MRHIKVIHLELKSNNSHYYYGSIAALCKYHSKDEIGIGYGYLRQKGISEEHCYENSKCVIRKGTLVTSSL